MITIYILQGYTGKYYTGITKNFLRRWREHNEGWSKSTKHMLPLKLIHKEEVPDMKFARLKEKYIKRIGTARYLSNGNFL